MKVLKNRVEDYDTANFTENETLWLVGSTYNYEDEARYGHYIYKYAGVDGTNTTDNPEDNYNNEEFPDWVKISPTNYFAMLDNKTQTQTVNPNTIEIGISSNNYDAISLLGLEAEEVTLTLTDNDTATVVYTNVIDLQDESDIIDFYTYCFEPFTFKDSIYDENIKLYTNSSLNVLIDNNTSDAKCGRLVFGRTFYIGETSYGSGLSLESYSKKETDTFGNTTLVPRDSVNLDSHLVQIPTNKIPVLRRKMKELDAVAILFVMDESETSNIENLLNFGYWQEFNIALNNKIKSIISLTVKGIL